MGIVSGDAPLSLQVEKGMLDPHSQVLPWPSLVPASHLSWDELKIMTVLSWHVLECSVALYNPCWVFSWVRAYWFARHSRFSRTVIFKLPGRKPRNWVCKQDCRLAGRNPEVTAWNTITHVQEPSFTSREKPEYSKPSSEQEDCEMGVKVEHSVLWL